MGKRIDITGQRYGMLVALEYVGMAETRNKNAPDGKQSFSVWRFRCDCGNEVDRKLLHVRKGDTKSCGCLFQEKVKIGWETRTKPYGESSFNGLFHHYKAGARARKIRWHLSEDEFRRLTKLPCYYCGQPPSQSYRTNVKSNGDYIYSGVDRMDSAGSYSKGNVVPCCGTCNYAKRGLTESAFLQWVKKVYEYQCEKNNDTF